MGKLSVSSAPPRSRRALLGDLPRADAAEFKLKIGAGHPPVGLWVATIKDVYMPRVTERAAKAGHKIEWTEAWGGAVCKLGECLEAVEAGLLDIADVHAPTEPAKLLANNFTFFAPFGTPDPRIAAKVVWDVYQSTPALKKVLEDRYKQVFIANGIVGNYGLVTNFKWAKVPELKGRKLAAIGPNIPWLQGTGAVGVQSTLNEAYTSMQTGVYEGWVMLADPILAFKLNEVSKQYVDMDFGCQATPLLTINRDTLQVDAAGPAEDHSRRGQGLQRGDGTGDLREAGRGGQAHEGARARDAPGRRGDQARLGEAAAPTSRSSASRRSTRRSCRARSSTRTSRR